jgi:hypothetical protein
MTFRVGLQSFVVAAASVVALILGSASPTLAAWSSPGRGSAAGAATALPTGMEPAGSATGSSVTISWPASTLPGGIHVAGYTIHRYSASSGTAETVGSGCSGVVTVTTCTEASVPQGTWLYTDTPVQGNWTGGASPDSAPIVVS